MATATEVLAAADRAEAAGDVAAAARLRAYAATLTPVDTPKYDPAQLKAAAERARAAGDEAAAQRLMAAIPADAYQVGVDGPALPPAGGRTEEQIRAGAAAPKPASTERLGDTAAALMAGPYAATQAFGNGLLGGPSPSREFLANDPMTRGLPSSVLTGLGYVGDSVAGPLSGLGTVFSGLVGLGVEAIPGQTASSREKLGGELLGMAQFAVPELAGASSIPARMATTATKAAPAAKAVKEATPTIESLRTAKSAAYKAVDEAGETFSPTEMTALRDRVETELADGNYVEGVDRQTDAVRSILERKAGGEMTLGQLDKLRQEFYKRLAAAPNEVGIHDAIDAIDDMIAARPDANGAMAAAREANSRYKKAELLDMAFEKAKNQTSATGSGGNILNKFRQAVVSVLNNPKQARWFSDAERTSMKAFVRGSKAQNAMRLVGKLSPGGNGLMTAINVLGAGATGGASVVGTGIAMAAKAVSDGAAMRGGANLIGEVSKKAPDAVTPGKQAARPSLPSAPYAAPIIGQEAASANRNPEYDALIGRYK